jgi:PAT family beta-lactamase induction signal transducer AmpG
MDGNRESRSPEKRTMRSVLAAFTNRHTVAMLALGFFAGLPLLLIFDTLSAWLREAGVTLEVISFFSLILLVYSFKFLWAPLVDRAAIPALTARLGHRRSWMIICQLQIVLGLLLLAASDPASSLLAVTFCALFVGLASATQDIVIDAWRIEAVEKTAQGAMAAAYQWGYYAAAIVGGSVPYILAELVDWHASYVAMAATMAIALAAVLLAPPEEEHALRPFPSALAASPVLELLEWAVRLALLAMCMFALALGLLGNSNGLTGSFSSGLSPRMAAVIQVAAVVLGLALLVISVSPIARWSSRPSAYLSAAFGEPLKDFFHRYRGFAALILALVCFYRLSSFVLSIMNPFYLDLGFTLADLAQVRSVFAVAAALLGLFLGGVAVARFGLMPALFIGAFAGPVTNLLLFWLTMHGPDLPALFVAVGVNSAASGFAGTCLIAYMSSLTSLGFTATQYALFSSLFVLPGRLLASQSGAIVEAAAKAADGGFLSPLTALFAGLPSESFANAQAQLGVMPAALAAGYATFFVYAGLLGVAAIALALIIVVQEARREQGLPEATKTPT